MAFTPLSDQEIKKIQTQPTGGGADLSGMAGDLGVNAAGALGGSIGQALGTPFDLLTGPGGTMAGGAIGGAIGQGGAEIGRELLPGGGGLNLQKILSQGGQGAAWGAVPGVEEARAAELGGETAAKSGVMDAVKTLTAKSLAGRTGIRLGTGAAAGATSQAISDVGQGKTPGTDVLTSGAESGGINALFPGVSTLAKYGIGTSNEMFNKVARNIVGDKDSRNPIIKGALVLTDQSGGKLPLWEQSVNSLDAKATKSMTDLQKEFKGKTMRLGDLIDAVKKDAIKGMDLSKPDAISTFNKRIESWVTQRVKDETGATQNIGGGPPAVAPDIIDPGEITGPGVAPKGRAFPPSTLPMVKPDLNKGFTMQGPEEGFIRPPTPLGIGTKTNINQQLNKDTQIPLTVANEVKKGLGTAFEKDKLGVNTKVTYSNVRQLIENTAEKFEKGSGKRVHDLNANYADLKRASKFATDKYAEGTKTNKLGENIDFIKRMAMNIAAGGLTGAIGLTTPGASVYSGPAAIPFVAAAVKELLTETPEKASKYGQFLQRVPDNILKPALQQLGIRYPVVQNQLQQQNQ